MKKQSVIVLGSTGSIGRQTLEVLKLHSDRFQLIGISAHRDFETLARQAKAFSVPYVACTLGGDQEQLPAGTTLFCGANACERLAEIPSDVVVLAVLGIAALKPLLKAIPNTKRIAIANKESLVCGGALVDAALKEHHTELLPIDSEQSAIFQCLQNGRKEEVSRLILTCSGGPFFRKTEEELKTVTMEDVLCHPTWRMGRKITLDSATLFNKGLEVIEAARLFHLSGEQISVLIHPQSIVHSMVEYRDGTVSANLSLPDMRLPIQYALTYPERLESPCTPLRLEQCKDLSFHEASSKALELAYAALRAEGGCPIVYNGANEQAAELFFQNKIAFLDIYRCVEVALSAYRPSEVGTYAGIEAVDSWARTFVTAYAAQIQ